MTRLKWKLVSVCLEIVLILTQRWVHYLRRMYHRLENVFGQSRWNSYVMWVMSNLVLVCSEMVLVLMQDRPTVCAK
jgi:hypothetical protein